jgi:hypothetical protein
LFNYFEMKQGSVTLARLDELHSNGGHPVDSPWNETIFAAPRASR